jgi:methylmalonyl-CoA mutase N-terminal domain/subunit
VAETIDPLGGSYYVESLTSEIEEKAREYLDRIDEMGGAVAAIEAGYIQREIVDNAYHEQQKIDSGERVVVGVNRFVDEQDVDLPRLSVDLSVEEAQRERLAALRQSRDKAMVDQHLARIRKAAGSDENLVPIILDAVHVYATLGEICDALRDVFGEYQQPTTI